MSSSRVVRDIIDHAYKGKRQDDDSNILLSIQPWGSDSDKRRYFLIEGRDDTAFRVYRESNPAGFHRTWFSVAGSIDEVKALIEKLETADKGPKAKKLAAKLSNEIKRFEATEEVRALSRPPPPLFFSPAPPQIMQMKERWSLTANQKRKRREYRQLRKEQFKRPEPGFSMYEGRTRGKRMKYTYSDDEDFMTDSTAPRRSMRNTGTHTPAEPPGPVVTASGRHIRAPSRLNVDTLSNGGFSTAASTQGDAPYGAAGQDVEMDDAAVGPTGRPRRTAAVNHGLNGWTSKKKRRNEFGSDDEDEDSEPDYGDDEEEDHVPDDSDVDEEEFADDDMLDEDEGDLGDSSGSLIVKFPIKVALDRETGKFVRLPAEAVSRDGGESTDRHYHHTGSPEGANGSPVSEAAKDEIPVAVRQSTPESDSNQLEKSDQPLTPSSGGMALAFRGSPEKPQQQHLPLEIDVGSGK